MSESMFPRLALRHPREADVRVQKDLPSGQVTYDLYLPPAGGAGAAPPPVVLITFGIPDAVLRPVIGTAMKDTGYLASWGRVLAAHGMAVAVPATQAPVRDVVDLLATLASDGDALGVDASRIAAMGWSGHGPVALHALLHDGGRTVRAAALLYAYAFPAEGGQPITALAAQYGMDYPLAGRDASALPAHVPLFVLRAGQDAFPELNRGLDDLAARALAGNRPLTLVNVPGAVHAFDLQRTAAAAPATAEELRALRSLIAFLAGALGVG